MTTEDYVSFETAKLLKEKGFDAPCLSFFWTEDTGSDIEYCDRPFTNKQLYSGQTLRPTLQMAMKWLREIHKLHIILDIHWLHFANQNGWMYTISRILENGNEYIDSRGDENDKNFYPTYEEACEAAIKYCLNLI